MNNLDIFLIDSDFTTYQDSLKSILNEVDSSIVKTTANHNSAYSAFNEMMQVCNKKYVFQVDGDQIMNPGFMQKVQESMKFLEENSKKYFIYCFASFDTFEECNLYAACKTYNLEVMKKNNVKFKDTRGCDREIIYDMRRICGLDKYLDPNPIALHALKECGPDFVFSRFQNRVYKDGINDHVRSLLNRSVKRFKEQKDPHAAACILGCCTNWVHSGEVKREQQYQYPDRQLFKDIETNWSIISQKVEEIIKKHKL